MSCEKKNRPDGTMTRGEFLGAGAAAAAAVATGTVGVAMGEAAEPGAVTRAGVASGNTSPPTPWSIKASELQVLWGEIFPRMVAEAWLWGRPFPFVPGDITHTLASDLEQHRNWYLGTASPTPAQLAAFADTQFGHRVNLLAEYLTVTPPDAVMPMRFHGFGAFDFILSDFGLDLFAPRPPETDAELLRYYEFRDPGRSTTGIPWYLDDANALAFDVQSPTGPSQVWTGTNGMGITISYGGDVLGDLPCLATLDGEAPQLPHSLEEARDFLLTRRGERLDPALLDLAETRFPETTIGPSYTIRSFTQAVGGRRRWQLEGSVYRGIIQQLPRVIATAWRDHCTGYMGPDSYWMRINDPARPEELRKIFQERLETSLPGSMACELGPSSLDDVVVSNEGIRFPPPISPPNLPWMLYAISKGRAGNPVFTDTRRPPRGE